MEIWIAEERKEAIAIRYMIHCKNQKSRKFLSVCRKCVCSDILQDAFELTYDRMRRYEGSWHLERQLCFPDYVFLESQDGEKLARELARIPEIRELVTNRIFLIPLAPEEEAFLWDLCGTSHHLGMSRGYIQEGRTYVTEGPLRGKEQLIRRIDRHKRIAQVEMPRASENTEYLIAAKRSYGEGGQGVKAAEGFRGLQIGLEIVAKN